MRHLDGRGLPLGAVEREFGIVSVVAARVGGQSPGKEVVVNRLEWQQLAERWLVDAKVLLDAHRWSAAYYLAGYAAECALKACILKRLVAEAEVIFEEKRFSERCWTHSTEELVKLAGLEAARAADVAANRTRANYWLTLRDWNEQRRYESVTHHTAKRLYRAITDNVNGVMQWIKAQW